MEKIIGALKLQHETIQRLRKGLCLVEAEPKEASDILDQIEKIYQDALVECGKYMKETL